MRDAVGLLRYASESVRHNGRRTFSSILGVLLAVTFISGTFIAIDSSTRAALDAMLTNVPGDFSISMYVNQSFGVNALRNRFLGLAGVTDASVFRSAPSGAIWMRSNTSAASYAWYGGNILGIDPAHPPIPFRSVEVAGTLDVPNGSVALSSDLANSMGVHLGDTLLLSNQYNSTVFWNMTLTVAGLVTAQPNQGSNYGGYYPYASPSAVVRLQDLNWILTRLHTWSFTFDLESQVWINRVFYVNPYDAAASATSLAQFRFRLESMLGVYGSVTDNISPVLSQFQATMTFERLEFLLLSAPVLLLGVYLGAIGVDLSHAERRRELAILKTRGAGRSQLVRLLLTESLIGGLIAAILGLAAGILLSRFLLGVVNPFALASPAPGDFLITRDTVLTVVVLSVLLMGAVTFRSARRTASLPVVETLRYYAPGETRTQYRPTLDIVLLGAGILAYAVIVYSMTSPGNLFTFLIYGLVSLALPFIPILIILGATRLATRSTVKVYEWTSRACEPLAKNLHHIIRQNLARNPRRSSNIAVIIALGLGFGMFSLSYYASSQLNQEQQLRAWIGADMVVTPAYASDAGLGGNLSALPGVAEVARVTTLGNVQSALPIFSYQPFQFGPGPYSSSGFFAVQPEAFFNVTTPESWYFTDGNAANALAVLETPGKVLVTQALADQAGLVRGLNLTLLASVYNSTGTITSTVTFNVTIGGIVRALPGVPGAGTGGYYGFGGAGPSANVQAVYGSETTFRQALSSFLSPSITGYSDTLAFFVGLQPGADWQSVQQSVASLGAMNVQVYQQQLDLLQSNPGTRSINGFMAIEVAFLVVILTAGLCLILYAATLERDTEFAAIIARGASGWQTAGLLLGEGFSILLVGLIVGASVGILTGYTETSLLYTGLYSSVQPLVPLTFVIPPEALLLLILAPVAMFLGALLVSVRIARMNVAKVLKMRGG